MGFVDRLTLRHYRRVLYDGKRVHYVIYSQFASRFSRCGASSVATFFAHHVNARQPASSHHSRKPREDLFIAKSIIGRLL